MKLTKEKLAAKLNGREYGDEITSKEKSLAKENNLVVVFGYSDDLMELEGAICDEIGAWEGSKIYLNDLGIIVNDCDDEDCPYFQKLVEHAPYYIEACWSEDDEFTWTYKTNIPVATFEILEDENKYCKGIAFSMDDLV